MTPPSPSRPSAPVGRARRLLGRHAPPFPSPSAGRTGALLAGLGLIGSFLGVFYHIVDVVGGVAWLAAAVAGAFLLGTGLAREGSDRAALGLGAAVLLGGAVVYVALVPAHHDRVLTVGFLVDLAGYLTGVSVLKFLRVDLWAVAVAPGPVVLTWYALLRRRYDLAALAGGATLGVFVLTGDAGRAATLVGSACALGVLGFGELDRVGGSWDQVERLGVVLVAVLLASRVLRRVGPSGTAAGSGSGTGTGGPGGTGGGGGGESTLEGSLVAADERVRVFGHISLSPTVRFTVTADEPAYWHVGAYDRYTGGGWVRSGQSTADLGALDPPPGETFELRQTFRPETTVEAMPAAWRPVRVLGEAAERTQVTSTGGVEPTGPLAVGEAYTVVSRVPEATPGRLRDAGTDYPREVRERYLQLPESTPARVGRRARGIAGDAATPYDAARAVGRWLRGEKAYSLDVDRPDGDVADAFVFGMDRGYCVYFATAMTVLLRSLGVPARFALGYTPGERVDDDRWVVRGLDSHAWTEVYFPGTGWVPFDPTPADPRRTAEGERLERARADGVDGVDTEATRPTPDPDAPGTPTDGDAAGSPGAGTPTAGGTDPGAAPDRTGPTPSVDPDSGVGPGGAFLDPLDVAGNRSGTPGGRSPDGPSLLARVDRLTLVAAVAGTVLGVHRFGLLSRLSRAVWLRRQPPTDSPSADVTRAYERVEHLLERRHRPRREGETVRAYLAALGPAVDARARRVARLHERARHAGAVSRAEADEAIRLADDLVRERA